MTTTDLTDITRSIFFGNTDLDDARVARAVTDGLHDADLGDLFLQSRMMQILGRDDGKLVTASALSNTGMGFRYVAGESTGYAHGNLDEDSLKRAIQTARGVRVSPQTADSVQVSAPPAGAPSTPLYSADNPLEGTSMQERAKLLEAVDDYVRSQVADMPGTEVVNVSVSLAASHDIIHIIGRDGRQAGDIRPLVRMDVSALLERNGIRERGACAFGGRHGDLQRFFDEAAWKGAANSAIQEATDNFGAVECPAGEMQVVLGPGWPGILLHEAVGHGLEGDFNRKGTSAFSGKIGQRVASSSVTVIDQGNIPNRRGSLNIDDEGTPTGTTFLIKDGILCGYMLDQLNARLMGVPTTGNGRRENFTFRVIPRMTNTYMLGGEHSPEEIIGSVRDGIYIALFAGGQVNITSGKFSFNANAAYRIRNGKIAERVRGATLIGIGAEVMQRIAMVGNDMALDPGIGTCLKDGQGVPVGVGQPTLLINGIAVGGTASPS